MGEIWKDVYESLEWTCNNSEYNVKEKILAFIDLILRKLSENKEISMLISHEQNFWMMLQKGIFVEYYEKFFKLVTELLATGQKERIVLPQYTPEVLATLLIGSIRYLVYTWQRGEIVAEHKTLFEQIKALLSDGIFK